MKLNRKVAIVLTLYLTSLTTMNLFAATASDVKVIYGYEAEVNKSTVEKDVSSLSQQYESLERIKEAAESYNTIREASVKMQELQVEVLKSKVSELEVSLVDIKEQIETNVLSYSVDEFLSKDAEYKNTIAETNSILEQIDTYVVTAGVYVPDTESESIKKQLEEKKSELENSSDLKDIGSIDNITYPVESGGRISSEYGTRVDPITGTTGAFHNALDIATAENTTIYATFGGKVTEAGYDRYLGNYVRISHGSGLETIYGHCNKLIVKDGDSVSQGDAIAEVGSTGRSTGPHVHWGVYIDGNTVDPSKLLQN